MIEPTVLIAAIFALALGYVLFPVMGETFTRFRGRRPVRCPECGELADVELDAAHGAVTAAFGRPGARIERCSLWPAREGCRQRCVPAVPGAEGAAPDPPAR